MSKMKRERATVKVIVRQKNDPTKKTYANLMELAQAYPRCHKMWHHPTEYWGEIYGLRNWHGYDWYAIDRNTNRWVYLQRSWERVPTFTVKKKAMNFGINSPWMAVHNPQ